MAGLRKHAALGLAILLCLSGCGVTEGMTEVSSNDAFAETEKVTEEPADPRQDFYRYVNGEKLAAAEFKYGDMFYQGAFDPELVDDQVKDIIRDVVSKDGYEKGSEEDIIKTAYDLFNAYDFEAPVVPAELDACLHEIDKVSTIDELLTLDAKLVTEYGVTSLFNLTIGEDYLSSGRMTLIFDQFKGVSDVNFETLEETYGALNSLKDTGSAIMQAMGHSKEEADESGNAFGVMVKELYNATNMDIINTDMPYKYFKKYSDDDIKGIFTNVDIDRYLELIGIAPEYRKSFAVLDQGQMAGLNSLLTDEYLDAFKTWEMVALSSKYRRFIASGYSELEKYRKIDYSSDEDRVLDEIMSVYEETDPLYVEKYYTKEMDDALIAMCDDIREGYRGLITQATWLSDATRKGLLEKLENIIYVTGSDRKRHDVNDYKTLSGDDYFQYYRNYLKLRTARNIAKLSKPADRKGIKMPMQMVNACYDPALNNITITVAITNPPFFDPEADYYTNLGGLGATIGHEMGHAFDSNCILFDQNGVFDPSWIDSKDMDALNARNEKAVRYFEDNFKIFGVYHVDGEQTLGENYADLGGVECILSLTETTEQRKLLFESYAATWCEKLVDAALLDQLDSDEHSPGLIRVNAILSTLDLFYDTYGVKEGDGMYIPPPSFLRYLWR